MYSIGFPDMFTSSSTNLVADHEASYQNLRLLLLSDTNSLLGDPYYGTPLRRTIYAQNDSVIRDLVVDAIYTSVLTFMPQVVLKRNDINVTSKDNQLYATLNSTNLIDYTTDMYDIKLTDTEKY